MNGAADVLSINGGVSNMSLNGFNPNSPGGAVSSPAMSNKAVAEHTVLLARCCLKQGEWQIAREKGNREVRSFWGLPSD